MEDFAKKWLILCEGQVDRAFFERLAELHAPALDEFQICIPGDGRSGFARYLNAIAINESFINNVQAILIVSDKDENANNSFDEVIAELHKTGFATPSAPGTAVKNGDQPAIVVLMIPVDTTTGNMESMCLPACHTRWKLEDEVTSFVASAPSHNWGVGKQAKAKIQSLLAVTNKKQPDAGFAASWKQKPEARIPLDHECFQSLVDFLKDFDSLIVLDSGDDDDDDDDREGTSNAKE